MVTIIMTVTIIIFIIIIIIIIIITGTRQHAADAGAEGPKEGERKGGRGSPVEAEE